MVGVKESAAKFPNVALVAYKLVEVTLVDVTLVNTAVEGVVPPIATPSKLPPVITALEDTKFVIFPFMAYKLVPEAVANPNQDVDVPLANDNAVIFPCAESKVAIVPLVA